MNSSSDADLLEQWRQGNRNAGKVLFERYYEALERFFANKVTEGIADLVHETFQMCLEARDRIGDPLKFRSYLFSIAYNVLRIYLRNKKRKGTELDPEEECVESLTPGPRSVLMEREEQRLLLEALRNIPVNDQVVLELFYWESLKVKDIATVLSIPSGTVKSRLHQARENLKSVLHELSASPNILESTLADLEGWARQCRRQIGRPSSVIVQ